MYFLLLSFLSARWTSDLLNSVAARITFSRAFLASRRAPHGGVRAPAGRHVRGRGVGFPPPDVLICRRLGLILLHFVFISYLRAKRAGIFAPQARFFQPKVTKVGKSCKSVEQKKTIFICCRARREDSKNAKKKHLRSRGGEKKHRV